MALSNRAIETPKIECVINADIQTNVGLGVLRARMPAPIAGIKKNHGTTTLIAPKTKPSQIVVLIIPHIFQRITYAIT